MYLCYRLFYTTRPYSLPEMILIDHEFKILFFTIYLYGNRVLSMNARRNVQFLILYNVTV